jgi:FkbM family methyltransferase
MFRSIYSRLEHAAKTRGYRITWVPRVIIEKPDTELRLDLEFVVAHLMLKKTEIFFVQIGANDGVTNDPLYKFVTRFGWSGILVEPMPSSFAELAENHKGRTNLKLINAAISACDGDRTLYTVRIDDRTFQKAEMYSSFDRNVVLRNSRFVPDIADRIIEVNVRCISMASLLRETEGRTVDILTIDTEGFDYAILKMIDFSLLHPAIICYEHAHLSKRDQDEAAKLLSGHGYRMTRDNLDTIAYRPEFSYGWRGGYQSCARS